MAFSDSHHLRKMVAGACMVLAPLLFLVGFIVSPQLESGAVAQLKQASAHVDRYYISNLIAMVALATATLALGIVGSAVMLVGLGSIGLIVLRETDADWEHTPDYRGFRPAAGMS